MERISLPLLTVGAAEAPPTPRTFPIGNLEGTSVVADGLAEEWTYRYLAASCSWADTERAVATCIGGRYGLQTSAERASCDACSARRVVDSTFGALSVPLGSMPA
jgi:hypothetical protein